MPPLAIAAGIGAIGSIGGALIGSSAQKSAANQANAAQQQATQAQLQLGQQSLDLNKQIYGSNYQTLSPYVSRGNVAGDSINALLGLGAAPAMQSPLGGTAMGSGVVPAPSGVQTAPVAAQQPYPGFPYAANAQGVAPTTQAAAQTASAPTPTPSAPYPGFPYAQTGVQGPAQRQALMGSESIGLPTGGPRALGGQTTLPLGGYAQANHGVMPTQGGVPAPAQGGTPAPATSTATPASASDALNNFANSAGMQFQLQQGTNALNNMYAAHGMLQSGAAMKGIQNYGQQTALNNYFMPYMGLLGGQQSVGAGAASSIAGVGSNFGNTAANINAGMGANIQNGANSASNAALLRGQATNNMWGSIGSSLGGLAGSLIGSGGGGGYTSGAFSSAGSPLYGNLFGGM